MRLFMIVFSILIGFSLLLGFDSFSVWTGLLLLIILFIGVLYMFTGKVLPQFIETFLIVLFIPLSVIYIYNLISQFIQSTSVNSQLSINVWPFLRVILFLMFLAFLYVLSIRRQNQRLDRFRLQGSEREPVVPNIPIGNSQDSN